MNPNVVIMPCFQLVEDHKFPTIKGVRKTQNNTDYKTLYDQRYFEFLIAIKTAIVDI